MSSLPGNAWTDDGVQGQARAAGDPAASIEGASPPLSDTGVNGQVNEAGDSANAVVGHVDYLKVTIWNETADRVTWLVSDWLERHCDVHEFGLEWIDKGPGPGFERRLVLGITGMSVLDYRDGGFVCLDLKGQACQLAGDEALRGLLQLLASGVHRYRCGRIDFAWDGVLFDVMTVKDAIERGDFVSKCRVELGKSEFFQGAGAGDGRTVYFPRRHAERFLRVYDKRGPVRVEIQLEKDFAEAAGEKCRDLATCEWPEYFKSQLVGLVDFVDAGATTRRKNAKRLPWWEEFVAGVVRPLKCSVPRERQRTTLLGRLYSAIDRSGRMLAAALEAFDDRPEEFLAWLTKYLRRKSFQGTVQHVELVRSLRTLRGSHFTGWSEIEGEVPF